MWIAILTTRTRLYHPNARLLEAASRKGCVARLLHPEAVFARTFDDEKEEDLPRVVVPRIGSTIEDHELAALFYLEQKGVPALNDFNSLVVARDKFLSLMKLASQGLSVPRTVLVQTEKEIPKAIEALGGLPVIAKGLRGRQGTGVEKVEDFAFARYLVSHPPFPLEGVLFQELLPQAAQGDIRTVVVMGKAIASMRRIPRKGEFRSNIHLRGMGEEFQPPGSWLGLAIRASEILGLKVAGVDMVEGPNGPIIIEVNTTPGFRELERVTGCDVAGAIIDAAMEVARKR